MGNLTCALESKHVNWGSFAKMLREQTPDDSRDGGALVVVRGWESQPHGEGGQFEWFVKRINRPQQGEDL